MIKKVTACFDLEIEHWSRLVFNVTKGVAELSCVARRVVSMVGFCCISKRLKRLSIRSHLCVMLCFWFVKYMLVWLGFVCRVGVRRNIARAYKNMQIIIKIKQGSGLV